MKLALAYGQDRGGKLTPMLGSNGEGDSVGLFQHEDFKSHNYYVGLSAPLAGGTAVATWTRTSSNLDDITNDDDWAAQNAYSIKYVYPLSKRTKVYAYGGYVKNVAYIEDLKGTEAGIGINHNF